MIDTLKKLGKVPDRHRRRALLRRRRHLLQLLRRGGAHRRGGHGHAGPGRQDRQRRHRRRRPVQRDGPDPGQPAQRPLPGADAGSADRQRLVRAAADLRQAGQHALARPQEPRRSDATTRPWQGGARPHPGRAARPDLLRGRQRHLRPRRAELADAHGAGLPRRACSIWPRSYGADGCTRSAPPTPAKHPGFEVPEEHRRQEAGRVLPQRQGRARRRYRRRDALPARGR